MTENTGVFGTPPGIGTSEDRSQFVVKPEISKETQSVRDMGGGSKPSSDRRLNSADTAPAGGGSVSLIAAIPFSHVPRDLRIAMLGCALVVAIGVVLAQHNTTFASGQFVWITSYFFHTQDQFWLIAAVALLTILALAPLPAATPAVLGLARRHSRIIVAFLAAIVVICGISGRHFVFDGYALSLDEVMARFDATIFSAGKTVAPLASEWRPYDGSLTPNFTVPIAGHAGVISAYLPINAAMHALVGTIADPGWTNPLLAALSVVLVFVIARRLWPGRPGTALLCALLLTTSSQVLVMSMTDYAMTGHLALNLLWLYFYLWDNKKGHFLAIVVGFFACGLHQLIFHPLFVTPFIFDILNSNRRRLFFIYVVSYGLICLFWVNYPGLNLEFNHMSPGWAGGGSISYFFHRIPGLIADPAGSGLLMLKNLLRFFVWQNLLLIPLCLLAWRPVREQQGIARGLQSGLIMTIPTIAVILAYQGYGWGYRYLHGVIGNFVLLAGYGWVYLSERAKKLELASARSAIFMVAAFFAVGSFPAQSKLARDFVAPYAKATFALDHAQSDIVLIDALGGLFSEDLARNDPFLRNSPKLMSLIRIKDVDLAELCSHYSVSVFNRDDAIFYGIMENSDYGKGTEEMFAKKRALLKQLSCGTPFKR